MFFSPVKVNLSICIFRMEENLALKQSRYTVDGIWKNVRECELELVVLSASKNCLGNKLLEKLLERINGCNMIRDRL